MTEGPVTLYAAPHSLYSGKARAYLRWKDIPFSEVTVTPEIYRDKIIPAVGMPIIPVIETANGTLVQDTTDIIDFFEERHLEPSVYPAGVRQRLAALLLELFGDEWLLIPAMHYRWTYDEDFTFGEFGRVAAPDADEETRRAAGRALGERFRAFLPMLGITPATRAAIERSYEDLLGELDTHFARHPYLFGTRPSIGDYGLIGPLYAHLYRDPNSGALMKRIAPHVAAWVERTEFPPAPGEGAFLPGDAVPDTLLPVLARQMREQVPVLAETARRWRAWSADHPDEDIPRAIGMQPFRLEGSEGTRAVIPYSLWMLQRALDFYRSTEGAARAALDSLLDAIGGGLLREIEISPRLARRNFRLVREEVGG